VAVSGSHHETQVEVIGCRQSVVEDKSARIHSFCR
jgi:hypothetical protein